MTDPRDLTRRNAEFATTAFSVDLTINPSGNMMVIGCVDPRVDPAHVLGLKNGEAAIIRNVGGRITPRTQPATRLKSAVALTRRRCGS
jgi:carbonic anhydrase